MTITTVSGIIVIIQVFINIMCWLGILKLKHETEQLNSDIERISRALQEKGIVVYFPVVK